MQPIRGIKSLFKKSILIFSLFFSLATFAQLGGNISELKKETRNSSICFSQISQQILKNRILTKYDKPISIACNDPRLLQEISHSLELSLFRSSANDEITAYSKITGFSLPKSINSPVVPITWATIKIDSPIQESIKKVTIGNGKMVDVISCSADVTIAVINKDVFKCASDIVENNENTRGVREKGFITLDQRMAIEKFVSNDDFINKVSGTVNYIAALANDDTPKTWINQGYKFENQSKLILRNAAEIQAANIVIEQAYSFFPMMTPLLSNTNSKPWTDTYSQYFLDKCKLQGLRNKTCQCVKNATEQRFSELDMQRLHYSSYNSAPTQVASGRAQNYFPFTANQWFHEKMYPDTKKYYAEVVEKCDAS